MPRLSNDSNQVKLYKLDPASAASGPLIATQLGHAPGDITFRQSLFLLRRDGLWVDFVALGAAAKADLWQACLFDKPVEVLNLLNSARLEAEVLALEVDATALEAWLKRTEALSVQERIDNLLRLYQTNGQ